MVELKSNDSFIYLKEFGVLLEEECILDQPERVNGSVDSVSVSNPLFVSITTFSLFFTLLTYIFYLGPSS